MSALAIRSLPVLALVGALSLAHAAEPATTPQGQELFRERCGGCHLEGGFGTRVLSRRVPEGQAELEKRTMLPAALTTMVVRRGLGSMPQIREAELSDAELAAIAAYLDKRP
ncbi:c-type cytochrome [Aurantiacibacter flavus]|uniref:Cytochrome c n=1 Tax=Aurantiacibacter flavus TaxID=3145232 RepID=A0ABV0CRY6_9SPHN